jgi:hypothetical protein
MIRFASLWFRKASSDETLNLEQSKKYLDDSKTTLDKCQVGLSSEPFDERLSHDAQVLEDQNR